MPGLLDLLRRAAPGEAPVDPLAGSVMSPGYIPETDKRQLALGGLRGLLDVSPVGMLDAATSAINRANLPSLAAVRAVTGRQALPGDALVGLLGQGGGAGYDAARSATQAVVPMMGLLGNQSAGALPAGYARDQSGAIVWHGSPHKFDKFDASKIGTGEGAQAYGHGLYLAENPATAQSYRTAGMFGNGNYGDGPNPEFTAHLLLGKKSEAEAKSMFDRLWSKDLGKEAADSAWKAAVQSFKEKTNLYKVDLPDESIAKMIDWDKPMSQQPESVRAVMERLAARSPEIARALAKDYKGNVAYIRLSGELGEMAAPLGQVIKANPKGASEFLRQQGIPGIRYLDGGSRAAGTGTSNYVVFPGEEGLLKILARE